jgi:Tol biopolymer transport system component
MKSRDFVQYLMLAAVLLSLGQDTASGEFAAGSTERVSVTSSGAQSNGPSTSPALSAGGRFVAFVSEANNLVRGDTNHLPDIFVHDRLSHTTERVNISKDGRQANGETFEPSISGDGRFVAFYSLATNLVSGDTNGSPDVFVHDRQNRVTKRISVSSDGIPGNGTSAAISSNGRFVVFSSSASMVPGDMNQTPDIYIHDLQTGSTERVSSAGDPEPYPNPYNDPWNPIVSPDGHFVVFSSAFWPIAGLVVRDRLAGILVPVQPTCPQELNWDCSWLRAKSITADGRYVAFYNEIGGLGVYIYDRMARITENLAVTLDGTWEFNKSGFVSGSSDMRFVAFHSWSSSLVFGDTNNHTDVFVRDRLTRKTALVSLSDSGNQGNGDSTSPSISANGRYVAFVSDADDLVSSDTNQEPDIFFRDRGREIFPPDGFLYLPLVVR